MKPTNTLLALAALTLGLASAAAQTSSTIKDDLFQGTEIFAKNATSVNEISMDPDSLGMVNGKDRMKAGNMVLNVVRSYEYDKPGQYNIADVETFRKKLSTGDWHCSVHSEDRKTGESTDICSKHRTDGLRETAIISVEPKELTFIHKIERITGYDSNGGGASGSTGDSSSISVELPQLAMLEAQAKQLQEQAGWQANAALLQAKMIEKNAQMQAWRAPGT